MSEIKQIEIYAFLGGRIAHVSGAPDNFSGVVGYYKNGNRHFRYPIHNGKFHGICMAWHENGNLAVEENYEHGRLIGWKRTWYPSGKPESEGFYSKGKKEGAVTKWHENGQLQSKGFLRIMCFPAQRWTGIFWGARRG